LGTKTVLILLYNVVISGLFVAWRGWRWTTICNSPGRETRTTNNSHLCNLKTLVKFTRNVVSNRNHPIQHVLAQRKWNFNRMLFKSAPFVLSGWICCFAIVQSVWWKWIIQLFGD
jgi:hypothetical protein